jgi:hypothetical protein
VVTARSAVYHLTMQTDASAELRIEERPDLFDELHRPFALGRSERLVARLLLALLRLPGGAGLLRRWHAGRAA